MVLVPEIGKHKQKHWALRSLTWRKKTRIMTTKSHTSHTTTFQPQFSLVQAHFSSGALNPLFFSLVLCCLTFVGLTLVIAYCWLTWSAPCQSYPCSAHHCWTRPCWARAQARARPEAGRLAQPQIAQTDTTCFNPCNATKQIGLQCTSFRSNATLSFCCSL